MFTVGHPAEIDPPWAVESPCRAAGCPPIMTVDDPTMMLSGGPAQVQLPPTTAAGWLPMSTVGTPAGSIGPPVCGLPFGFAIGQVCMSPILAAAGISWFLEVIS